MIHKFLLLFCIVIAWVGSGSTAATQSANALQLSFAGGGLSSINGGAALYNNPAEMMFNSFRTGSSFELGSVTSSSSLYYDLSSNLNDLQQNAFFPLLRTNFIPTNYTDVKLNKTVNQSMVITPLMGSIHFRDFSLGLGFRTRFQSQMISSDFWNSELNATHKERNLSYQTAHWQEFTMGFARSVDYLNLLRSNFNQVNVGFSVSLLLPYSYETLKLSQKLSQEQTFETLELTSNGKSQSIYSSTNFPIENQSFAFNEMTQINGYGLGLSMGFSYTLPFESEYQQILKNRPIRKYWKLSVAITDLGGFIFKNPPVRLNKTDSTSILNPLIGSQLSSSFQLTLSQRQELLKSPLVQSLWENPTIGENQSIYLPTMIKSSFAINYLRLKISLDLNYALNQNLALNHTLSIIGSGEIYILPFWAIRSGLMLKDYTPDNFSIGTGINLWFFTWDAALQYQMDNPVLSQISGLAITSLKIRF